MQATPTDDGTLLQSWTDAGPSSQTAVGDTRPVPRGTAAYPRKEPSPRASFDPASIKILEQMSELGAAVEKCQHAIESLAGRLAQHANPLPAGSDYPQASPEVDHTRLLPQSIESMSRWPIFGIPHITRRREGLVTTPGDREMELSTSIDDLQPRFVRQLLDQFFQHVHVKNPVLEETQIRRLVARFCAEGLDWSPESCLVLLVLALGSSATPFEDPEQGTKDSVTLSSARSFYKAAQKRLALAIHGPDRVLEARCYFLSGVYAMTLFQRDAAWKFFLHALACCQHFQFLRSPDGHETHTFDPVRADDDNARQRSLTMEQTIYWSSWKSERELRQDIENPDFALTQAELAIYPQFFPTPPIIESDESLDLIERTHDRQELSWYFYLSEISLRRLASCIANGIVQFKTPPGEYFLDGLAKATCVHESQAEEWAIRLPQVVSLEYPKEKDNICQFVLRGHLINLYEIIYWPFVNELINGFTMGGDRVLMFSLARKGLQKHVERILVNQAGYKHRHHGTLFLLYNCSRSALVLMATALSIEGQLSKEVSPGISMPFGWRRAVELALEMNRYWEAKESVDSEYLVRVLEAVWRRVEPLDI